MSQSRSILTESNAFTRVTGGVYRYLVVEVAFVLAGLPGIAGIVLLEPTAGNVPLYVLCLIPVLPAFSAAVSASRPTAELTPWRRYWQCWRANVRDVLLVTSPALVALAVLVFNVAFGAIAGTFFVVAALVLAVAVVLWCVNAVLIASLFRFRTRDTARLAAYYLIAKPLATIGTICLLVIAAAVVATMTAWALLAAASVLAGLVRAGARPIIADVEARFIATS
ncbi:DUF624 domain-containing protein [Microbacterium protaetiae]|uniref:DUF624 domain-containing protein n=1 Tax=Microbacterium protaetiae TaxID=2509458 RepID=A0A4P6ED05_9MICO|nr:DUF624 domain-containing protein [Microbacterium protaetiae]QAY58919.1 DUF624 domain-containing protein [Microbacterium protaetiae]